jgi:D-alanyl-lipoteichoic acid acyltransferase DltB (MBOAT superfamily)
MLFNSYAFIFAFMPAVLAGFFLLGRASRGMAIAWLIAVSLVFYAIWRPVNVLIMAPSVLINLGIARGLLRLREDPDRRIAANALLGCGIAFNLLFLAYFKYMNFAGQVLQDTFGVDLVLQQVILPLGISFITFQKIAFLVDVRAGRIQDFSLRDYALFVLFFPQLIAGPIVHYREMMPQFASLDCRPRSEDLTVGLTLFTIGLFKKVVLADGIAPEVSRVFALAHGGQEVSFVWAWLAAVGFTVQIYFDFSGYSDMALGLARLFGVKLPANFDSPLKASNIIDFWLRWHITLTRFLTAYLYNPLALWLTRRRVARRLSLLGSRHFSWGAFFQLLALPTILTMLLSGIWHGAGYTFIVWGVLHGCFLTANHAWRYLKPRWVAMSPGLAWLEKALGAALTFVAVSVAMAVFCAPDLAAAKTILSGMFGFGGLDLPAQLVNQLGRVGSLIDVGAAALGGARDLLVGCAWMMALLAVALLLPGSLDLLSQHEPALGVKQRPADTRFSRAIGQWRPSLPWAIALSAAAFAAITRLDGKSEFLYWQF